MMEQWVDGMIVSPSDGPLFILIDWKWFSKTMGCWLGLRAYQTVNKEFDFISFRLKEIKKNRKIDNFARNCVK